jgi:hypothetical protein
MTLACRTHRVPLGMGLGALVLFVFSGCSLQSRAVTAASTAWSCPEARVQVAPAPIPNSEPQPAADVAADPARLAIWQQSHPDPSDIREFSASGCGKTGMIECRYAYDVVNQNLHWTCALAAPHQALVVVFPSPSATPKPSPSTPSPSATPPSPAPSAR